MPNLLIDNPFSKSLHSGYWQFKRPSGQKSRTKRSVQIVCLIAVVWWYLLCDKVVRQRTIRFDGRKLIQHCNLIRRHTTAYYRPKRYWLDKAYLVVKQLPLQSLAPIQFFHFRQLLTDTGVTPADVVNTASHLQHDTCRQMTDCAAFRQRLKTSPFNAWREVWKTFVKRQLPQGPSAGVINIVCNFRLGLISDDQSHLKLRHDTIGLQAALRPDI